MSILKIYTIKFLNGKTQTFYANYQEEVERVISKIEDFNSEVIDWEERTLLKCTQCKMYVPQHNIRIVTYGDNVYSSIYYCEECYVNKINCFAKLNELKNKHRERENNE